MHLHLGVRGLLIAGLVGVSGWVAVAQEAGWSQPVSISRTPGNSRYQGTVCVAHQYLAGRRWDWGRGGNGSRFDR